MLERGELEKSGLVTALRVEICGGWHLFDPNTTPMPTENEVSDVLDEILEYSGPVDMPPEPRHLRLLVDAAAALHGETSRAAGWRILGVKSNSGRRMLGAESDRVTWSTWFTALTFGLGYARFDSIEDYSDEEG